MAQVLEQLEQFSISFGYPQLLYVLVVVPLMAIVIWWADYRRNKAINRLGDPELINRLSVFVNWQGRRLHTRLWLLAFVLIVFALARPQWGSDVQILERQGVQVMVALDVSQSMLAEDVRPNRLTRAKLEIGDLIDNLDSDEIGLVLFSGASFIQFPLTFDYGTAQSFLANANPGLISRQGTALAEAIDTAMAGFDLEREGQKVLIIMTDGEDHQGDALLAADVASQQDVVIYTVAFGTEGGGLIPIYNNAAEIIEYKTDINGDVVYSKADEAILQEIASKTGGKFYKASDSGVIEALTIELDSLEKANVENEVASQRVERFHIFLLIALAALAVIELIPDRVKRKEETPAMTSEAAQ